MICRVILGPKPMGPEETRLLHTTLHLGPKLTCFACPDRHQKKHLLPQNVFLPTTGYIFHLSHKLQLSWMVERGTQGWWRPHAPTLCWSLDHNLNILPPKGFATRPNHPPSPHGKKVGGRSPASWPVWWPLCLQRQTRRPGLGKATGSPRGRGLCVLCRSAGWAKR